MTNNVNPVPYQGTSVADSLGLTPSPKKKPKTGLIVGLSVGGVALVAVIIIVVVLVLQARISPVDYAHMADSLGDAKSQYSDVVTDVQAEILLSSNDDTQALKKDVEKLASIKSSSKKLTTMKAYKDADVAKSYDTMIKRIDSYSAYVSAFAKNKPIMAKALNSCGEDATNDNPDMNSDDPATQIAAMDTSLGTCQAALTDISKVNDKAMVSFANTFGGQIAQVKSISGQMVALGPKSTIELSQSLVDQFNSLEGQFNSKVDSLNSDYSSETQDLEKSLKAAEEKAEATKSIEDFENQLSDKQNA